jgi:hypothetical protein
MHNHPDVVQELLDRGANVNIKIDGVSILKHVNSNPRPQQYPVDLGAKKEINKFLVFAGARLGERYTKKGGYRKTRRRRKPKRKNTRRKGNRKTKRRRSSKKNRLTKKRK